MPKTQLLVVVPSNVQALTYMRGLLSISRDQNKISRNQKLTEFVGSNSIILSDFTIILERITTDFINKNIDYPKLNIEIKDYVTSKDRAQKADALNSFIITQGVGLVRQNIYHGMLTHILPSIQGVNKEKLAKYKRNIINNMFKDLLGTLENGHLIYQAAVIDAYSSFILFNKLLEQFSICDLHCETYISYVFDELTKIKEGLETVPLKVDELLRVLKLKHTFYREHQLPNKTEETISLCRLLVEKIDTHVSTNKNQQINDNLLAGKIVLTNYIDELQNNKEIVMVPNKWQVALKDWEQFHDSIWKATSAEIKIEDELIFYDELTDDCTALQTQINKKPKDQDEQLAILNQLMNILKKYKNMPTRLSNRQLILAVHTLLEDLMKQYDAKSFMTTDCSRLSIRGVLQTITTEISKDLSKVLINGLESLVKEVDNTFHNKELHVVFKELKEIQETDADEDRKAKIQGWIANTDIKKLFGLVKKYLLRNEVEIFAHYATRLSVAHELCVLIKKLPSMAHLVPLSQEILVRILNHTIEFYTQRRDICQVWDFLISDIVKIEHFQISEEFLAQFKEMVTIALCEDVHQFGGNATEVFITKPIVNISALDLYLTIYDLVKLVIKYGAAYIAILDKVPFDNEKAKVNLPACNHRDLLNYFAYISAFYAENSLTESLEQQIASLMIVLNRNGQFSLESMPKEIKLDDKQAIEKITALNKITNLFNVFSFILNLLKYSDRTGPRSTFERSFAEQCAFVKNVYSNLTQETLLEKEHFDAASLLAGLFRSLCYARTTEFQSDIKDLYALTLHIISIFNKIENKTGPILALQQIYQMFCKSLLNKMRLVMAQAAQPEVITSRPEEVAETAVIIEPVDAEITLLEAQLKMHSITDKETLQVKDELRRKAFHEQAQTAHDETILTLQKQFEDELERKQQELDDEFSKFTLSEDEKYQKSKEALSQAHQANLNKLRKDSQRKSQEVKLKHQQQLDRLRSANTKELNRARSTHGTELADTRKALKQQNSEKKAAEVKLQRLAMEAIKAEFTEKCEKAKNDASSNLATKKEELNQRLENFKEECNRQYLAGVAELKLQAEVTLRERKLALDAECQILENELQSKLQTVGTAIKISLETAISDLELKAKSRIDEMQVMHVEHSLRKPVSTFPKSIGKITYAKQHAFILTQLVKANIPFLIVGLYPLKCYLGCLEHDEPMSVVVNAKRDSLPEEFLQFSSTTSDQNQLRMGNLIIECKPWDTPQGMLRSRRFNIDVLASDFDGNLYDILNILPEIEGKELRIQESYLSKVKSDPVLLFRLLKYMGKFGFSVLESQRSMLLLNQYLIAAMPFSQYLNEVTQLFICKEHIVNLINTINFGALSGIIPSISEDYREVLQKNHHPYLHQFWCHELTFINMNQLNTKSYRIIALFLLLPTLETMRITGSTAIDSVDAAIHKFTRQFTSGLIEEDKTSLTKALKSLLIFSDPTFEEQLPPEHHSLMTRYKVFIQQVMVAQATIEPPKLYLTSYKKQQHTSQNPEVNYQKRRCKKG